MRFDDHDLHDGDSRRDFWEVPVAPLRRSGAGRRRDPFLLRVAILVGLVVLLVPVALAARGDATSPLLRSGATGVAAAVPEVAPAAAAPVPAASRPGATVHGGAAAAETALTAQPVATEAPDPSAATAPTTVGAVAAPTPARVEAADRPEVVVTVAATVPEVRVPATSSEEADRSTRRIVECTVDYEVAPGDAWFSIAGRFDVAVADLLDANAAAVDTALYAGDTICLPPDVQAATTTTSAATTTTTTAPPAPTTTVAPSPARTWNRAEVEAIIREVWPDDLEDEAIRIAIRESNLVPTVRNWCCFGLFQIYFDVHRSWLAGIGVTSATQLYDPVVNAKAALATYYRAGGWGPWQTG